jgi:hypothetical protein
LLFAGPLTAQAPVWDTADPSWARLRADSLELARGHLVIEAAVALAAERVGAREMAYWVRLRYQRADSQVTTLVLPHDAERLAAALAGTGAELRTGTEGLGTSVRARRPDAPELEFGCERGPGCRPDGPWILRDRLEPFDVQRVARAIGAARAALAARR